MNLLMDALVKGASGDFIQGVQAFQDERYVKAGSHFAQSAGGTLLALSAFTGVLPGGQVVGALLFVGGIGLKYLDEAQERGKGLSMSPPRTSRSSPANTGSSAATRATSIRWPSPPPSSG